MRVALISPWYREHTRGNAVTVRRLERHLRMSGVDLGLFALDERSEMDVVSSVVSGGFDLCHAFHADIGGRVARCVNALSGIPYLITLTGSDLYEALFDSRRDDVLSCLHSASSIVSFHTAVAGRIISQDASIADRITVIPQGVELPDIQADSRESDRFVFLLPAGIRPVKNLLFPLEPLARLHRQHPETRLHIVGPVLDQAYAAHLFETLKKHPFARYLGVVDHAFMGELYRDAHVVINSSHFEGGMANSLLEAMAWGKPVLASDVEGNRSLVTEGVNGLLYGDSQFLEKASRLLNDPELRMRLGRGGRRLMEEMHSPGQEALSYLKLYDEIVGGGVAEKVIAP